MQRVLMPLAIAVMLLAAGKAAAVPSMMYIVGEATEGGWNKSLATPMVSVASGLFIYDGYLGVGQFKFTTNCMPYTNESTVENELKYGEFNGCYVAKGRDNVSINDAYETELGVDYCSPAPDYKYYNNYPGYYRLVLYVPDGEVWSLRVYKPMLYICGGATPSGWALDKAIPVFPELNTNYLKGSWTGILRKGDFKFPVAASDYYPCFNAPTENQLLRTDSYTMAYNPGDGSVTVNDYKFVVDREGLYTLEFDLTDKYKTILKVTTAAEPDNLGAYILREGDYVVAVNATTSMPERRIFTAPVPTQLYIYNYFDPNDCQLIQRTGDGLFTGKVNLYAGRWYKLVVDPSAPNTTSFSPNRDTTIGSRSRAASTKYNVLPMNGYSYIVETDGFYEVTADFYDGRTTWGGVTYATAPTLRATYLQTTAVDDTDFSDNITIRAEPGRIVVTGTTDDDPIVVCNLAGVVVGTSAVTYVSPGLYVVRAADTVAKVVVK